MTAQVMAGARFGGAELFYERLCAALHATGEGVLPVFRRNAPRAARLRAAGLSPRELRFGGLLDVLTRPRLARLLHSAAPRIVVAWMSRAAAATPPGDWALVGRLGGYYDLRRFARCDHLVGNTRDIADWIIGQGWPAARVHHLPNFVPDFGHCDAANRASLGVPADAPMLLGLGRLHPAKGFDTLVRALAALPGAHAVIAGEGPERASLVHLARAQGVAGRLHLPGWRDDTGALLAAADVFVCSSRSEPLGNMVLEAWSAGRPVIATRAQGPLALIRPGQDGLLITPENPAELAGAVATLLANQGHAADLAAAGRARYLDGFTEHAVTQAWRGFFASVAR